MTVAVIVPYRGGQMHRDRNWEWIEARYRDLHPWPVIQADCDGPWSKGAAVNTAAASTDADILVVADADSFVPPETLTEAVHLATHVPWVVPHGDVLRLTEPSTLQALAGGPIVTKPLDRPRYEGPAGGGIVVLTRTAFDAVGGVDPRFLDWGGEDICWAMALDTLVGPHHRIGAQLVHLWHPHPSPGMVKPPASQALMHAYIAARWHPAQMRAVLAGVPYTAPEPLDRPRCFHTPRPVRSVHVGTERARFRDHLFSTTDPDLAEAVAKFPNVQEVT